MLDTATRFGSATDACLPSVVRTLCRLLVVDYDSTWPILRNLLVNDTLGYKCFLLLLALAQEPNTDLVKRWATVGDS